MSLTLGRLYLGSYPILEFPGWPVRLRLFHKEADCCPEVRSVAVEFVNRAGDGRGFEAEWTVAPRRWVGRA